LRITRRVFEQVRERAGGVCEYCGVSDVDSGGPLTVDHFRPRARSGSHSLDNLVYACFRCNTYKQAYWADPDAPAELWNPREGPASEHLWEQDDGRLLALTDSGRQSIRILRLNRPALVRYRRTRRRNQERDRLLARLTEVIQLRLRAEGERSHALADQTDLLEELRSVLEAHDRLEP